MSEFLTVNEIAEKMGVLPQTVRRWIREKKLQAQKLNNSFIIAIQDFEQFLQKKGAVENE